MSYRDKHNEANGENNHDGTDANFSENYGAEGETTDAGIEALRKRQIKNFLLTLLISRGVPMLLGGDEFRRTQGGNNNAYCQDNETSWVDWSDLEQHQEIYRFARGHDRLSPRASGSEQGAILHGRRDPVVRPARGLPNWADPKEKSLRLRDPGKRTRLRFLLMFNAGTNDTTFALPPLPQGFRWHLAVDTSGLRRKTCSPQERKRLVDHSKPYRLEAAPARYFWHESRKLPRERATTGPRACRLLSDSIFHPKHLANR